MLWYKTQIRTESPHNWHYKDLFFSNYHVTIYCPSVATDLPSLWMWRWHRPLKYRKLFLLLLIHFIIIFTVPAEELVKICPDCPSLIPLHDPEGLKSVRSAVQKFHDDSKPIHYFRLMEVGRMSSQVGAHTWSSFPLNTAEECKIITKDI